MSLPEHPDANLVFCRRLQPPVTVCGTALAAAPAPGRRDGREAPPPCYPLVKLRRGVLHKRGGESFDLIKKILHKR